MISRQPFPTEITGTSFDSPSSPLVGPPWYNGIYFEAAKNKFDAQDFLEELPSNHKLLLPYSDGVHQNIKYDIRYPQLIEMS